MGSARTTLCGSLATSLTKLTLLVQIRVVSVLSNHLARCQIGYTTGDRETHLLRLAYDLVSNVGVSLGQVWLTADRDAT